MVTQLGRTLVQERLQPLRTFIRPATRTAGTIIVAQRVGVEGLAVRLEPTRDASSMHPQRSCDFDDRFPAIALQHCQRPSIQPNVMRLFQLPLQLAALAAG